MSLYTKYRPRDWDSVIGQDTISTILRSALRLNQVGHAYILSGSRGTGKTTSARILAKGVNCENLQDGNPCHTCANCIAFDEGNMLDVIEIDGASTNGVDDVRGLIEKARFEPNQGKYKIYIIDEVHMLSTSAFNALLKTLEEPPDHVKFILATTEIDSVPETIRSRSLRFDFRKITEGDLIKRLNYVIKEEGITAAPDALAIIAKAARGGMRDALTLLEQHIINNAVSTEYVRTSLSLLEDSLIEEVISTLCDKNIDKMLNILDVLKDRHLQVRGFFDQVLYSLRDKMFESINTPIFYEYEALFGVFESAYSKIRVIPDSALLIEITLIRGVKRGNKQQETPEIKGKNVENENHKKNTILGNVKNMESEGNKISEKDDNQGGKSVLMGARGEGTVGTVLKNSTTKSEASTEGAPLREALEVPLGYGLPPETFDTFGYKSIEEKNISKKNEGESFNFILLLNALKTTKPALVTDLKSAQFEAKDNIFKLSFQKEWNYNRVNAPDVKNLLTETLEKQFGGIWKVECMLGKGSIDITEGVF